MSKKQIVQEEEGFEQPEVTSFFSTFLSNWTPSSILKNEAVSGLKEVPERFKDGNEYREILVNLLFEDFRAQIINSLIESEPHSGNGESQITSTQQYQQQQQQQQYQQYNNRTTHQIRNIMNRNGYNSGISTHIFTGNNISFKSITKDGFEQYTVEVDRDGLHLNDFVVLEYTIEHDEPISMFGIVKQVHNTYVIIMFKSIYGVLDLNVKFQLPGHYSIKVLTQASTIIREVSVGGMVNTLELKDEIIVTDGAITDAEQEAPNIHTNRMAKYKFPDKLKEIFQKKLNQSQMNCIYAALRRQKGITLYVGPPGTGKTTLIQALASVLNAVIEEDKQQQKKQEDKAVRILICTPSNDTANEITHRLLNDGLVGKEGKIITPRICRVGECPDGLLTSSLHNLTEENVAKLQRTNDQRIVQGRNNLDRLADEINDKRNIYNDLSKQYEFNYQKSILDCKKKVKSELEELEKKEERDRNGYSRYCYGISKQMVLDECDIIISTLSSSGLKAMITSKPYDVVIIDEAGQASELESLIPLQNGVRKLILIGDIHQLPPTIVSPIAIKYKFNRSLLESLLEFYPSTLLDTQYRMNPIISKFTSDATYGGELKDSEKVKDTNKTFTINLMVFLVHW